jgi:hypothetical protein
MKRYWVFDYSAETPLRNIPALPPTVVDEQGEPRQRADKVLHRGPVETEDEFLLRFHQSAGFLAGVARNAGRPYLVYGRLSDDARVFEPLLPGSGRSQVEGDTRIRRE